MSIELLEESDHPVGANIKVIGVGGAGGNALNHMINEGLSGVEFIAMNTDAQDLRRSLAPRRFQLGAQLTKGLGAGGRPDVGREAALEDRDRIAELVHGADMVFIAAGMGGGTGTGAAPVVAQVAREAGALTVGVVTRPFRFEAKQRRKAAQLGIDTMAANVDTLVTVPNNRLLDIASEQTTTLDAFRMADDVLLQAVRGVADLITCQGRINVDFADVRSTMMGKGVALMGVGIASGDHRATDAATMAINSPMLDDVTMTGADSVLINITSGTELRLFELNEAVTLIQEEAHEEANVIFGWVVDPSLKEDVRVTVIATGLDGTASAASVATTAAARGRVPRRPAAAASSLGPGIDRITEDYDIPVAFKNVD